MVLSQQMKELEMDFKTYSKIFIFEYNIIVNNKCCHQNNVIFVH
jgi:hypothetical protein